MKNLFILLICTLHKGVWLKVPDKNNFTWWLQKCQKPNYIERRNGFGVSESVSRLIVKRILDT